MGNSRNVGVTDVEFAPTSNPSSRKATKYPILGSKELRVSSVQGGAFKMTSCFHANAWCMVFITASRWIKIVLEQKYSLFPQATQSAACVFSLLQILFCKTSVLHWYPDVVRVANVDAPHRIASEDRKNSVLMTQIRAAQLHDWATDWRSDEVVGCFSFFNFCRKCVCRSLLTGMRDVYFHSNLWVPSCVISASYESEWNKRNTSGIQVTTKHWIYK